MSQEQLDIAFHPHSIAVLGTSGNPLSLGYNFLAHLVNYGYQGRIYPVTPKWEEILGCPVYPSLTDIPDSVDYVICCLPAARIPDFLRECPGKGVRVVHLFTGRFSETGQAEAAEQEQALLRLARELGIRLIGPNCMGIYHPAERIAFGYDFPTEPGRLGMFFQSGATCTEFIYYTSIRGIRFSKVVSYGNALDIDESDLMAYLCQDKDTDVITSYIEGIKDGRKFFETLGQTARKKPVILLKAGRGKVGAEAAASHTAAMAGSLKIWEAAIKQSGAIHAGSLSDMIELAVSFYCLPPIHSTRVGVVGGGGGQSVLSADEWEEAGFDVAPLTQDMEEMIRQTMPELWWGWIKNPVDVSLLPVDAVSAGLNSRIMKMMCQSDHFDLVVVNIGVGGPFDKAIFTEYLRNNVEEIIQVAKMNTKPLVVVLDTGAMGPKEFDNERWKSIAEASSKLIDAGIPVYPSSGQAAASIIRLIRYYQWRETVG